MKNIDNYEISNKNILIRVDLNVPVVDGEVKDLSRITAIKSTVEKLSIRKNKIFLISHFGRPKGKYNKKLSLEFLIKIICKELKIEKIHFIESINTKNIEKIKKIMKRGEIALLENIRFYPQEENNDLNFSKELSKSFDFYVNNAFSVSHRSHSSVVGLPKFLPSFAGLSFIKEINNLDFFLNKTKKPNIAIIGGSKISTKFKVFYNLINLFDSIVIGGAMANTFLISNNINLGKSLLEKNFVEEAKDIQMKAKKEKCKIILPIDVVCSKSLEDKGNIKMCNIDRVLSDEMVLDIGDKTINLISNEILKCRSILWNGPLGAFEFKPFDRSSIEIANLIKKSSKELNIDTLAGGGDTLSAINLAKAQDGFNYLSNAGGAFLEWLEGNKSPGFIALEKNNL